MRFKEPVSSAAVFIRPIIRVVTLYFLINNLFLNPLTAAGVPCGADITKKLDLQVTCQQTGLQDRRYYIKIFNRGTSSITLQNMNLTMKVWVYESGLRCLTVCGQNGDVYDQTGTRLGTMVIQGNTYSNFVSAPLYIEDSYHKSNQEGTYTFTYQSGQSTIPAGGWVQGFQILFSSNCGGLSESSPVNSYVYNGLFYYNAPVMSDAVREVPPGSILADEDMTAMGSGNWDNFNDDYSGLPLGQSSCGGNMAGPYYDDHHFALYSNGTLAGETKSDGSVDPETGVPPGAGPCTPTMTKTVTPTRTPSNTSTRTITPTYSRTTTFTRTITPTATGTKTPALTVAASPSITKTATRTATQTATPTATLTYSRTPTATSTPTKTPSVTPPATATYTFTTTYTGTSTPTPSITGTATPTLTITSTPSPTTSLTATPTFTGTPSATPTMTASVTPTYSLTLTLTLTSTLTSTPTATPTYSLTPTLTATLTVTPTITETITPSASASVSPTVSLSDTDTPTITPTATPTYSLTLTLTSTLTITPTVTETITPTITPTVTPTYSLTLTLTATLTITPTITETITLTVTQTITPTVTETITRTATLTYTLTMTFTITSTVTPTIIAPCYQSVSQFPAWGQGVGMAVDDAGNIYDVEYDTASVQMIKFTSGGQYVKNWTVPYGKLASGNGNLYLADQGGNRIQIYDLDGNNTGTIGTGVAGDDSAPLQFNGPTDVTVGIGGFIYVLDTGNSRVVKLNPDGSFSNAWGGSGTEEGHLYVPGAIAQGASGNIYVYEQGWSKMSVFTPDGVFISRWNSVGPNPGNFDMKFGPDGMLYISNDGNNNIEVFDTSGNLITTIGSGSGNGAGYFTRARIVFDVSGDIYASDYYSRVQKFVKCGTAQTPTFTPTQMPTTAVPCYQAISQFPAWGQSEGLAADNAGNIYDEEYDTASVQMIKFTSAGQFVKNWPVPYGKVAFGNGKLYVVDNSSRVQVYDTDGNNTGTIGTGTQGNGTDPLQFYQPSDIVVGIGGFIYVLDAGNSRVVKLYPDGSFAKTWGNSGILDGQLYAPTKITQDNAGNIYVCEQGSSKMSVFSADGVFITRWNSVGPNNQILDMKLGPDGLLYMSAQGTNEIEVFDTSGNLIEAFVPSGRNAGQLLNAYITFDASGGILAADYNLRVQRFIKCGTLPTPTPTQSVYCMRYMNTWNVSTHPDGAAADANGNLYLSGTYPNMIEELDGNGQEIRSWSACSGPGDPMNGPARLAIADNSRIYVPEKNNYRISVFDMTGTFITSIGSYGAGTDPIQFNSPGAVSADTAGNIYVADSGNNRIMKLHINTDNTASLVWAKGGYGILYGQLIDPEGIAVDASGFVYVAEAGNNRISKFDNNGNFVLAWGSSGTDAGFFITPADVKISPEGLVYTAEEGNNRIQVFDAVGTLINSIGQTGSDPAQFHSPYVALGGGQVYAAETINNRVQKFGLCTNVMPVGTPLPDLAATGLNIVDDGVTRTFTAMITNVASSVFASASPYVYVSIYAGDPRFGGVLVGTGVTAGPVAAGAPVNVVIALPVTVTVGGPLWVVADDSGNLTSHFQDPNKANNFYNSEIFPGPPVARSPDIKPSYTQTLTETFTITPTPTITPISLTPIIPGPGLCFKSGIEDHVEAPGYSGPGVLVDYDQVKWAWANCTGAPWISFNPGGGSAPVQDIYDTLYTRNISLAPGAYTANIFMTADNNFSMKINGAIVAECKTGACYANCALYSADVISDGHVSLETTVTDWGDLTGLCYQICFEPTGAGVYSPTATPTTTNTPTQTVTPTGTETFVTPVNTFTSSQTITPTATITDTPTTTPTLMIILTPIPGAYAVRVNCADYGYTDNIQRVWSSDHAYEPGSYGYVNIGNTYGTFAAISGTDANHTYDMVREDYTLEYRFDVPPGDYQVRLFMAEYADGYDAPGQRIFSVSMEGNTVLQDLDLYNTAGYKTAYEPVFDVHVDSGTLDIVFNASVDMATIAGIEVLGLQAMNTPTPTATPVPGAYHMRLDCGSGVNYTDSNNFTWVNDQSYFISGGYGYSTAGTEIQVVGAQPGDVRDTLDGAIYLNYFKGSDIEYRFDVPPGSYNVTLKWAELAYQDAGQRLFDVYLENNKVVENLDLYYMAGFSRVYDKTFYNVTVTDGTLNVRLAASDGSVGDAIISAIEVVGLQPMPTATVTQTITMTPTFYQSPTCTQTNTITPTITGTPPTPTPTAHANVYILQFQKFDGSGAISSDGAELTQRMNVIGTVDVSNLDHWNLECSPVGQNNWSVIASGNTTINGVNGGVLGVFDPTMMLNGQYSLRVTAYETNGSYLRSATSNATFTVDGNMKIGNFTLSFTDLDVPVAGIPMQVIRTYDSRMKSTGYFGYGWTLDIANIGLQESCVMGDYWTAQIKPAGLTIGLFSITPLMSHIVTITIPGGKVYRFEALPSPGDNLVGMGAGFNMNYYQLGGAGASLKPLDMNGDMTASGEAPGNFTFYDTNTGVEYDPGLYQLTTQDGTIYVISRTAGLQYMTDLNGNKLIVDKAGIHYSNGGAVIKEILFQRDGMGRIIRVTDPDGKYMTYTYNSTGDLIQYKDRTFTDPATLSQVRPAPAQPYVSYDYVNHYLTDINDPEGVTPIKNTYDPVTNRLLSHTGADGRIISYAYDLNNNNENVMDCGTLSMQYTYDARGNIISETDALGNQTIYQYDGYDNKLWELLPDNMNKKTYYMYDNPQNNLMTGQTDAMGNTTAYKYDNLGHVTDTQDGRGNWTHSVYSPVTGNLISSTDAMSGTTSYTYNPDGSINTQTDAGGAVTKYDYDGSGNVIKETSLYGAADAHWVTYEYDGNGNRTAEHRQQSSSVTLDTYYSYDASGRNILTTYPDGTTVKTIYDSLGKPVVRTDQKNRETQTTYDNMGRVETVQFPDGTSEHTDYNCGRKWHFTDRGGYTTVYEYDADGRLYRTDYADNSYTQTNYYPQGWVMTERDMTGVVTSYAYDHAGRRTNMDRGGVSVTYIYDQNGNQTQVLGPGSMVTNMQYDEYNRLTWQNTNLVPAAKQFSYDPMGRKTSETDENGKTTGYGYDLLGRLTAVMDAHGGTTGYTYDYAGNMLTQSDARNNVTRFTYDVMNRRHTRQLPLLQTETYSYDETENVTSKQTFKGDTITYGYDPQTDRLTSKDIPEYGPVNYTYYGSGTRKTMTDQSGTTQYTYDSYLGKYLITKASPEGTLNYSYATGGQLTWVHSDNANGVDTTYQYDGAGRLLTVTDNRLGNSTGYSYDSAGSLTTCAYPNGVVQNWQYDNDNRLTWIGIANSGGTLKNFTYTLGPTGVRDSVLENSGRAITWSYDSLYRLTNETVTNSTTSPNYSANYSYDVVGNRQTRTITPNGALPQLPDQSFVGNYDANDRLTAGYGYDNNGSTTTAPDGSTYTYDAENKLLTAVIGSNTISYIYDGDGNRVEKSVTGGVGSVMTKYLVDTNNPTGYSQVLEELGGTVVQKRYTYGLDLISQTDNSTGNTNYYGYDGIGSTRLLTDSTGTITDTYDYDVFGTLVYHSGNTVNNHLFQGEQYDTDLNQYYLRARYMRSDIGRFWTMDNYEGNINNPLSLNNFEFALNNPIIFGDKSGNVAITQLTDINNLILEYLPNTAIAIKELYWLRPTSTEEGLLDRLFIAEIESSASNYERGLLLAGFVIMNRLKDEDFMFHSDSVFGVVTYEGQFNGFGNYPDIADTVANSPKDIIFSTLNLATKSNFYGKFIATVKYYVDETLKMENMSLAEVHKLDPHGDAGGTYYWRSTGKPGKYFKNVKVLESAGGCDFYSK